MLTGGIGRADYFLREAPGARGRSRIGGILGFKDEKNDAGWGLVGWKSSKDTTLVPPTEGRASRG